MFSANTSQVSEDRLYVEDVFSTYLYTGNDSALEINNGIDLAGKGGLVWIKTRSLAKPNRLWDTTRGLNSLSSNTTGAQIANLTDRDLTSFNSNGFSLGMDYYDANPPSPMASWTFREAPKFFDVVTYTGDGSDPRSIPHSLGATPGMVIVKRTSSSGEWKVWFRTTSNSGLLNTNAQFDTSSFSTGAPRYQGYISAASSSDFTVTGGVQVNASGEQYVAYVFGHDTTSDGLIQCGTYTGNGSTSGPTVTLGWEPQWVMVKCLTNSYNWHIVDNMRGMVVGGSDADLIPNSSSAEQLIDWISPNSTGFQITTTGVEQNQSGQTYLYVAIRRGPMRTPTSGTSVFNMATRVGTGTNTVLTGAGFPVDLVVAKSRFADWEDDWNWGDRLRGISSNLSSNKTAAQAGNTGLWFNSFASMTGYTVGSGASINRSTSNFIDYYFRRAPSFFDEVCYTGTGSALTLNHNLGATPEMVIVKSRSNTTNWAVYHSALGTGKWIPLNLTNAALTNASYWSAFTSTSMTLGTDPDVNAASTYTYVAYLFASCPGVSKVGSYTGNGSSQTINCGFAAGARFVMIKRTDSTGDWYVWDSARGIVSGNDPHLSLNSTAAEVTTDDSVDTDSSGFVVNQLSATNINVSSATYIYLAVA